MAWVKVASTNIINNINKHTIKQENEQTNKKQISKHLKNVIQITKQTHTTNKNTKKIYTNKHYNTIA